ncbi:MAG: hypothetical protein FWF81_01035, partial [Defluviitaleaceae bacterium]|nr:hypothetical protein [Defluviitaleaceae bacterium]
KIIESGTHQELLLKKGTYHEMFTVQAEKFNETVHENITPVPLNKNKLKLEIEPFNDFWLDCNSTIIFTLLLSNKDIDKAIIYNNNYEYKRATELTPQGNNFYSLVTHTNVDEITKNVLINTESIRVSDEENIIDLLISFLNQQKIVLLGIDMFYGITQNIHWHKNHIMHSIIVFGYDNEKEMFHIMDSGKNGFASFDMPYEDVIIATRAFPDESYISDMGSELGDLMYTRKDIVTNAKTIIRSIEKINMENSIWEIKTLCNDDENYFYDIVGTHLFEIKNRQKANKLLFQIAFCFNPMYNKMNLETEFEKLEADHGLLKNKFIKLSKTNKLLEKIFELECELHELLNREYELWKYFIQDNNYEFIIEKQS